MSSTADAGGLAAFRGLPLAWLAQRPRLRVSREAILQAIVLLAIAVLTRITRIGDPAITGDEQFYLVVGDRMWHGALPFVDIWDRKPIGLFLLYALVRPLSHDGIIAYQAAATLFAAATAFVLARIAMRSTGPVAATCAGAIYLCFLPAIGGVGGQSPVFFDLFSASAALLVVDGLTRPVDPTTARRKGLAAMLLVGMAIQIKYTVLFEGVAFGLVLLLLEWRRQASVSRLTVYAAALVATALLPTALAFGFYAIEGHAAAFFSANFLSIFQKTKPENFSEVETFLVPTALLMAPVLLMAGVATAVVFARGRPSAAFLFLLFWSAFAVIEFFAIGRYSDHYAIPLLAPLALVIACAFDWALFAATASSLTVLALVLTPNVLSRSRTERDIVRTAALTDALSPYARKGCIYVYDGPPILYLTTHACLPTRYVFPTHLADADEARATDARASMAALLASRPAAIVTADIPPINPRNRVTQEMLATALASNYHLVRTLPDLGRRMELIYARDDLR